MKLVKNGPNMKATPEGFSIRFDRHRRCWEWRQTLGAQKSAEQGHVVKLAGYRTRPLALKGILEELQRREDHVIAPQHGGESTPESIVAE